MYGQKLWLFLFMEKILLNLTSKVELMIRSSSSEYGTHTFSNILIANLLSSKVYETG